MSQTSQQPVDADLPTLAAGTHAFSGPARLGRSAASVTDGLHVGLGDGCQRFVFQFDRGPTGSGHLSPSQDAQVPFHDLLSGVWVADS